MNLKLPPTSASKAIYTFFKDTEDIQLTLMDRKIVEITKRCSWIPFCLPEDECKDLCEIFIRRHRALSKVDNQIFWDSTHGNMWVDVAYDYPSSMTLMASMCREYLMESMEFHNRYVFSLHSLSTNASTKYGRAIRELALDHIWWTKYGLKYLPNMFVDSVIETLISKLELAGFHGDKYHEVRQLNTYTQGLYLVLKAFERHTSRPRGA